MRHGAVGEGPPCPVDPRHGRLYSWGPKPDRAWWCGNDAHGGNGKFFSAEEAHGEYELKEEDVTTIYDAAVRAVVAGRTSVDQAVQDLVKQTNRSPSEVREALNVMIGTVNERKERQVTETRATRPRPKARPAAAGGGRKLLEHVDGDRFAAVRDELGFTNKELIPILAPTTKLGTASPAYVNILMRDGASIVLFDRYEAALRAAAKGRTKKKK